jgi:hypothetical protein
MAKGKGTKRQTTICKTVHRKLRTKSNDIVSLDIQLTNVSIENLLSASNIFSTDNYKVLQM